MKYVISFILCMAIYFAFRFIKARTFNSISNKMYQALLDDDVEGFNKLCTGRLTKLFVPPFNIVYSRINFNTLNDHEAEARKLVDYVCPLKINEKEKMALFNLILPYFLDKQDKAYVSKISKGIKELLAKKDDEKSKLILSELELLLDVYIRANVKREPELLELINQTTGEICNIHKQRLAILYVNLHRESEAKVLFDEIIASTQNELLKHKMEEISSAIQD